MKSKIQKSINTDPRKFIFKYIVLEVSRLLLCLHMQRPKRQAAENALAKIRDIREWETLPETSQRFKECAALIDAELEAEIKKKKVKTCDLDMSESEEEESQDKFYDAHDGFVIADDQICDADPDFKIKEHDLLQEESDDSQMSAVTEHEEEQEEEDEVEDEQEDELEDDEEDEEDYEEQHEEDGEEDQKKDEKNNDEQAEPEKWEDALENFDVLPTFVDEEVDALQQFDALDQFDALKQLNNLKQLNALQQF